MEPSALSFNGILGQFIPDFSTLLPAVASRQPHGNRYSYGSRDHINFQVSGIQDSLGSTLINALPPFIPILNTLLYKAGNGKENGKLKSVITNVGILHDVAFSPKCPILGTGHHFAVFAAPFDAEDRGLVPVDGRAINGEVYCLKNPNFTSSAAADSPASKNGFKTEYYNTALQEIRVLLHPRLRRCENIISLFGLDFQEDYDDHTVAWPVLLMEYAEYGTLATLQEDINIDAELARILLLDMALGIKALHECNIIHGDVKSENVLICRHAHRKYVARLADFGLSVINPDSNGKRYRLPGGTFRWSAPELGNELSVDGLRQTDVYSFGLTIWRVLSNHPNPFVLIPPSALGIHASSTVDEAVTVAKSQPHFDALVLRTLGSSGKVAYSRPVIESTLSKDPMHRNLDIAISTLGFDTGDVSSDHNHEPMASETYWVMEEPSLVLEQFESVWTDMLPSFVMKPSVIHSLVDGLESLFSGNSKLSRQAGWILFQLASSPQFQLLGKDSNKCCQILVRLCNQGVLSAQAIVFRFHDLCGENSQQLDPKWLEIASAEGSSHALKSLSEQYPEKYRRIIQSRLTIEPDLTHLQEQAMLLRYCRQGDYARCKMLLENGVAAFPVEERMVSPLHWLVSFQDKDQISDLLRLFLENGAMIDAWEGEESDFVFGRVTGTPLHWAVWYRNINVLLALVGADDNPKVSHLNRAINIAAGMHFYDVLEILKLWALSLKDATQAQCDWRTALNCVAENSTLQLPRRLRHGDTNLRTALERTMDSILAVYMPSEEDIMILFKGAVSQNHGILFRYLFTRLDLGRRGILNKPDFDPVVISIGAGFRDIFELCIENQLLGVETGHGTQKWKTLQVCCFMRQREPSFPRRLLEIGCQVDAVSDNAQALWTPFAIAVSVGLYHIAIMFLEHGADKDHLLGWLGGQTITMSLLQNWPDIPISRLKFLLEDVPRLGFGHVTFWGWPGAGGNLLYALAFSHWSSYTAGYRLGETAKYILSQLADKSCLNRIDKLGATALRMACASGNLEICRALIAAGQDVNLAIGYTPLANAMDWMEKCRKREKVAMTNKKGAGSERRLATMLRQRAEQTVQLMVNNGAINRGFFESIENTKAYVTSGQWNRPSFAASRKNSILSSFWLLTISQTLFEMLTPLFDTSPLVKPGSTPLQPTSSAEFKAHHGQRSFLQSKLVNLGIEMDNAKGQMRQRPPGRWQQHNCLPWRSDHCKSSTQGAFCNSSRVLSLPTSEIQSQHYLRQPTSHANTVSRHPTHLDADTSTYSNLYDASFVIPRTQRLPDDNTKLKLIDVEKVEQRLKDHLFVPFFDDWGSLTNIQKRDQALYVLKEQLHTPISLAVPCHDIANCKEFARIKDSIETYLEAMNIGGVFFFPELSDNGREIVIHV